MGRIMRIQMHEKWVVSIKKVYFVELLLLCDRNSTVVAHVNEYIQQTEPSESNAKNMRSVYSKVFMSGQYLYR